MAPVLTQQKTLTVIFSIKLETNVKKFEVNEHFLRLVDELHRQLVMGLIGPVFVSVHEIILSSEFSAKSHSCIFTDVSGMRTLESDEFVNITLPWLIEKE